MAKTLLQHSVSQEKEGKPTNVIDSEPIHIIRRHPSSPIEEIKKRESELRKTLSILSTIEDATQVCFIDDDRI